MSKTSPVIFINKLKKITEFISENSRSYRNLNNENIEISIHGSGWYKNKIINSIHDFSDSINQINYSNIANSIGSNLRGSVCCYVKHKDHIYILPDPLGSAIVFKYEHEHTVVISSDIESILKTLKTKNIIIKKNINYLIEVISTGNGGFNTSSYIDIEAIKPFEYISIYNSSIKLSTYVKKNDFFNPENKDVLFEKSREEILQNISATLNHNGNKISHLTGGFDSRLVLSALSCLPSFKENYGFFCSGNKELLDKQIALSLASHFGLTMTDSDGTFSDSIITPNFDYSNGLIKISVPTNSLPNNLIISGGYGECLRSFYDNKYILDTNFNTQDIVRSLYGDFCFNKDPSARLVSDEFYESYNYKLGEFINNALSIGVNKDAVFDYMYLTIRNRYYVGLTSLYISNVSDRVDPLYSLSGFKLALNTNLQHRSENHIGLNLMKSFNQTLLSLPFDSEKIHLNYEKLYGEVQRLSPKKNQVTFKSILDGIQKNSNIKNTIKHVKPSDADIQKARSLRAPLWQITSLPLVQAELRKNLQEIESASIKQIFNYKLLKRLSEAELNNRVHIRYAHGINEALKWYMK